jgi:hypothetical protein
MEVRSVLWPAKVYVGLHEFSCQISNFSLGGAKVRMDLPLKEGTSVILSIPNRGDIPSTIAWVSNGALGIEFSVSINTIREMFKDRLGILGLEN